MTFAEKKRKLLDIYAAFEEAAQPCAKSPRRKEIQKGRD